jgi:hypothetical protein
MLILLASPDGLLKDGAPDAAVSGALVQAKKDGNAVAVVSNHGKPDWFDHIFNGTGVQFLQDIGRQDGKNIQANAARLELNRFDVLVLAASETDVQMGKNGGAVLVAAGWSKDKAVSQLGIRIDDGKQLAEVVRLSSGWEGQWWFSADGPHYNVRALADLSGYLKAQDQQAFAQRVTATVKNGGARLNALLAVSARSLLTDGITSKAGLWGVYPSSNSANADGEILSDFTHRLRTTASRVQFAKRGHPLFIRHKPSTKRSTAGVSVDRADPTEQLLTVHLNPHYKGKLSGKHAIVIDDCTTYGVSFGVAATLLLKAGAGAVTGVALGKFGGKLHRYEIELTADPFTPLTKQEIKAIKYFSFEGATNKTSQSTLLELIP